MAILVAFGRSAMSAEYLAVSVAKGYGKTPLAKLRAIGVTDITSLPKPFENHWALKPKFLLKGFAYGREPVGLGVLPIQRAVFSVAAFNVSCVNFWHKGLRVDGERQTEYDVRIRFLPFRFQFETPEIQLSGVSALQGSLVSGLLCPENIFHPITDGSVTKLDWLDSQNLHPMTHGPGMALPSLRHLITGH
jgi:hypothetical protein